MEASLGIEGIPAIGSKECPRAHDVGAALHLLVQSFDRVRGMELGRVLAREGHVGQHVVLTGVHEVGELGPAGAELLGDLAPCLTGMGAVGLVEGLNAYVRDGFLPETVLARAGLRETDDRLPAIVAAIKGADPDITLQAICTRLEAMRQRTPRGRTSWQPSSVKMLLERAERLGLLD